MIGICGFGVIGQAVYSYFSNRVPKPSIYDKYKEIGSLAYLIYNCDVIFLCLPTLGYGQDSSEFEKVLEKLIEDNYSGLVVIKSTVLYSNIKPYLTKLNIVINPEFLSQHDAIKDMKNRKTTILGGDVDNLDKVSRIYLNVNSTLDNI